MNNTAYKKGMKTRRAVLGNTHVDNAEKNKTSFDAGFQQYITENVWGGVWSGEGISRTERHMVTIAILAALGKEHELEMHIRATINTGLTPIQLQEIFMHVAAYSGVPNANAAFAIAKRVLTEQGRVQTKIKKVKTLSGKKNG